MPVYNSTHTGLEIDSILDSAFLKSEAQTLSSTIDSTYLKITDAASNYIPISSISTSVNSNNNNTVASSSAIKAVNDKVTVTHTTLQCTTTIGATSCVCEYYLMGFFKAFVISIRASSTISRTRHTVTLPSGYTFGNIICYNTMSNDNNSFSGYTKEFNCPLWVSGGTLTLDVHKGSGLASTYEPPAMGIYIITT